MTAQKAIKDDNLLAGPIFTMPQPPPAKSSDFLKAYKSWTYSAITRISRETSQVQLKLFKKKIIRRGKNTKVEIEEVF